MPPLWKAGASSRTPNTRPTRSSLRDIKSALGMTLLLFCAAARCTAADTPLLPPFPAVAEIRAGEATAPAEAAPDGLRLPVRFEGPHDRVYWDIPLPARIPKAATALQLILSCSDAAPLRGLSVHLQSGDGWHNASPAFTPGPCQRLDLPRGLFQTEGTPGPWEKSRTLRLSAWKQAAGATLLTLHTAAARTDAIAIVRATDATAPGEAAFAAALADRCARLLAKAAIPAAVIDDTLDALDPYSLLLLPYSPTLPARQLDRLSRFLDRNGRLIVFYNASPQLAASLGLRPGSWQGTEPAQAWSALVCAPPLLTGAPSRIPHVTTSMIPPFARPGSDARVIATWADDTGRVTDLPACLLTPRGAWFAHVPPLAYPSAAALMNALARDLCPSLGLPPLPPPPTPAPLPEASSANEMRAAWNPLPTARHPRGWNGLLAQLAAHRLNTLFVHWQSAATPLHTRAGSRTSSDTLDEALAAAARHKIALYAWATCWTLEGADPALITRLTREGRLMRDAAGNTLPWLCPSLPENRTLLIDGLSALARRGVAGIHLDYVRYPETAGCYAPATRKAFEAAHGQPVAAWPADVLPGGPLAAPFADFRRATMTAFIREARAALRAAAPGVTLSAAVFPTPAAAAERGQAWPDWLRDGLVDFVCPMLYTESAADFNAWLDLCLAAAPADKLVPGLGTGADECQLEAASAAAQIAETRRRRLAGFAFFAVDDELTGRLLPTLFPAR